jgi:peptide/nickel transport system substrate-binding protein
MSDSTSLSLASCVLRVLRAFVLHPIKQSQPQLKDVSILGCAVLLAGCQLNPASLATTKVAPRSGGAITEALVGTIGPLNPLFESGDNEKEIDGLIYQGLTAVDERQQVAGLLATSWTIADGNRTYTFQLRPDQRWADGQPFTADDVLFTFHILQDPAYQQPDASNWRQLTVAKLAQDRVQFTLKAPSASFPLALRQGIIPKHIFQKIPIDQIAANTHSNARAFGTGPFKVGSISQDRKTVTLQPNFNAGPRPYLDSFTFRTYAALTDALEAVDRGEAEAAGALQPQLPDLVKRPELSVNEFQTFSYVAVLFNLTPATQTFFESTAVRVALVQAIDRNRIIQDVLEGHAQAAPGPIPPTSWAYAQAQAEKHPYNPEAAAAALERAGWLLNSRTGFRAKGNQQFTLTLEALDGYPYRQVASAIAKQLAAVGVKVEVHPVPEFSLIGQKLANKNYQMALVAFDMGPDPDQYTLWHSDPPPGVLNFSSPGLPRRALIDKDLEDGRASGDRAARINSYADFQGLMSDGAPGIFLFTPHYDYIVSKRVKGLRINPVIDPVDRFEHVANWYVNNQAA